MRPRAEERAESKQMSAAPFVNTESPVAKTKCHEGGTAARVRLRHETPASSDTVPMESHRRGWREFYILTKVKKEKDERRENEDEVTGQKTCLLFNFLALAV